MVMHLREREKERKRENEREEEAGQAGKKYAPFFFSYHLCSTSPNSSPAVEVNCYFPDGLIVVSPLFSVSLHVLLSKREER